MLLASLWTGVAGAATWFPLGPFGGSARSFATDPADARHIYLGTATGWVYDSRDGGLHWNRVAQIAKRNDLVIDHIVADRVNPRRLVVGAYTVDHLHDGGIFISEDAGKNWYSQAEMRGQSVRSLARSHSDPRELVAGTLRGVFRSTDNGTHWQQISPVDSTEIKEVQSIAIDPQDPGVIYAGTWHLPWKTTDGGTTWSNIKDGIIDDSDVFSIIVDPDNPRVVYASACSGIYKSADAGGLFHKVQGIPSTARRTRTLEQDPANLNVVYAGTTEGLYRTEDAGAHWDRLTAADVVVNDVYVDPDNDKHVLIATDRGGVYRSEDAGASFEASNDGFSARQVIAYAADVQAPGTIYVGVVNDKTTGGVFQSTDGGVKWQQASDGLAGRDVFSLLSLPDGTLLAGTGHGIFRLQGATWQDSSALEGPPVVRTPERRSAAEATLPAPTRLHSPGPVQHAPVPSKSKAGPAAEHSRPHAVPGRPAVSRSKAVTPHSRKSPTGHAHAKTAALLVSPRQPGFFRLVGWQTPKKITHKPAKATTKVKTRTAVQPAHVAARAVAAHKTMHPAALTQTRTTARTVPEKSVEAKPVASTRLDAVVYAMRVAGDALYAGTSSGLLQSRDMGQHWMAVSSLGIDEVHYLSTMPGGQGAGSVLVAAGINGVALSSDHGATWSGIGLPHGLTQIGAVALDAEGSLWVGGREGIWYTTDRGANWKTLRNLFLPQVDSLYFDPVESRLLVTSSTSPVAFSVTMGEHKVTYWDTGWKLRFVRPVGDHLIGATLFDGVVVEPKMVDSPVAGAPTAAK